MSTTTQLTTVPADLIGVQALRPAKPIERERKPASAIVKPPADSDVRLEIKTGTQAGVFIYTIVDRASGQVMAQIPYQDLKNLAARSDYAAGLVVDTKV